MRLIPLILLVSSTLLACKKDTGLGGSGVTIGKPFEAAIQQTATVLAGHGGPITVRLTDVQESRCPSGAQCVWAGYVAVTIGLTDGTAVLQTARISLGYKGLPTYSLDSVAVTLNQQAYWLRLLDVLPYPSLAGSSQPKTATLRLRRR